MSPVAKGTCLLQEEPFVYNLSSKYRAERCDFCLKNPSKLFKCSGCCYVYYCGGHCQSAAWPDHKHECGKIKSCPAKDIPDSLRMMAKLVIKLQNNGYSQRSFYTKTESRKFRDLMSHEKEIQADSTRREYFETCLLPFLNNFFGACQTMPSTKELLQIYGKMAVNSFNILDGEMNSIGTGIYLAASILDHNCEPNAVAVFEGRTLSIRSISDMPNVNWDKIFISYIDLMDDTETRRNSLKKNYYFLCACRKCVSHATNERIMSAAQCPNCQEAYFVEDVEGGCSKCPTVASANFIEEFQECTEISKLRLAEMANTAFLDMSKICLSKQKRVLHPMNILHVKTLDIAFDSSIALQKFEEAAEFGKELLSGFIYYQGESNPLVGIFLLKMGKLFDFLGRTEEAEGYLLDAEKILKVTHGGEHSVYRDALVPLLQATRQ